MKDIVIIGAGGHAREIAHLIEDINLHQPTWNILGFIEKDESRRGEILGKYPILGSEDFFETRSEEIAAVISIGSPALIQKIHSNLAVRFPNIIFPNLIHPGVQPYMRGVGLGEGNIICAGTILTTDIEIGSFNCINRACNISHDDVIHNYCVINPGANISGGVVIEDGCLVGTGATILQYLTIHERAIVGAGAVVTHDVEAGTTVVGVPAKPIKGSDTDF